MAKQENVINIQAYQEGWKRADDYLVEYIRQYGQEIPTSHVRKNNDGTYYISEELDNIIEGAMQMEMGTGDAVHWTEIFEYVLPRISD